MSHADQHDSRLARKTWVAVLSVASNTTLVTIKLAVGLVAGSVSIISEAIHSGVDLLAALIALFSVRNSGKPADEDHPFGHGKYENISGAVEALLIFLAAWWIIKEAIHKLIKPRPLDLDIMGWGVVVMFVSAAVNAVVSRMLMKIGKETDSIALRADAWHLKTDVYTSIGVMIGVAIIWVGGMVFPNVNLLWVDPIAAILVALLIIKAAWDLTVESVRDLLDVSISKEEETWIRNLVAGTKYTIRGFHGLRTRKAGSARFIEFHLVFDGSMTIAEAHRISHELGDAISSHFPGSFIIDHVEPCDGSCKTSCLKGCMLIESDRVQRQDAYRKAHEANATARFAAQP